ncbi:hypothetical protein J1P26_20695 [Neobacillus sp. MM2021_6]|uniref:hypothetical protein n=1 Tax=Bacillaceae TaxID=186817 RepID=UPI00140B9C5A|nr:MULTISPECIES: hypothetical protein [Bacillaceae]MBO0962129.1 hypothetical protein [Neobacillus sp. MM2021_6]NHC20970.1 hypothetical protein [Bacillus sp. MM2020_4]
MLNYITRWHQIIIRRISVTFGLPKDLSHHPSSWHKQHPERVSQLHKNTTNWHNKHNKRVAAFHKNHVFKIERGENGNRLLAKWERFVYNKGKTLFKTAK